MFDFAFRTRFPLLLNGLPLAMLLSVLLADVAVAQPRPNIVVFLVDDMGMMDTSVPFLQDEQGAPKRYPLNDFYRTPNMARLAAQGIRFNNFYAMSVCSPTRVSIMSGQNSARHHTTNWINPNKDNAGDFGPADWNWAGLTSKSVTLARLLQRTGYRTIHIGKGHFGPFGYEGENPTNLGFDVNIAGTAIGQPGSYYGEKNYGNLGKNQNGVPHLQKYHGSPTFLTDALTQEAKTQVDASIEAKQPFYLYLPHYGVHAPFNSDPRFAGKYADSGQPAPAQAFATLIEGIDRSLGDLLDHLVTAGVAENTLFFFLGDNGTDAPLGPELEVACAAPLRGKKGAYYEGGMRTCLTAAWAKPNPDNLLQKSLPIKQGAIQTQLAAVYDLFPTILQVARVNAPSDYLIDGQSLAKLLAGEADPTRGEKFLMHYPHGLHRGDYFTVYRNGDWKLIYHYLPNTSPGSGKKSCELFHLKSDPFEQNDVAETQPEVLRRLMAEMVARLESEGAQYPHRADGKPIVPAFP